MSNNYQLCKLFANKTTVKKSNKMYKINFKAFRKANKMTQQELADYFGVGQGFISQIEKGNRPVPERFISKLLADESKDSSMIQPIVPDDEIKMSREVFDKFSQLIDTVSSLKDVVSNQQQTISNQHQTIDRLISSQHSIPDAHPDDDAGCVAAK